MRVDNAGLTNINISIKYVLRFVVCSMSLFFVSGIGFKIGCVRFQSRFALMQRYTHHTHTSYCSCELLWAIFRVRDNSLVVHLDFIFQFACFFSSSTFFLLLRRLLVRLWKCFWNYSEYVLGVAEVRCCVRQALVKGVYIWLLSSLYIIKGKNSVGGGVRLFNVFALDLLCRLASSS